MSVLRLSRLIVPLIFAPVVGGCEPYVVQYRKKPAYYSQMASASFKDGVTKDGVEIRWEEPEATTTDPFQQKIGNEVFRIREENQDGVVTLRAKLPQHILVNVLACLRNAEYQIIWDQMLAESTKRYYEDRPDGYEEFEQYLRTNRKDLAGFVNRMIVGRTFGEVEIEEAADGTIRCRLRKKLRPHFTYKEVLIVPESRNLKLLTIR